nr:carbohydrate kinase [Chloroflexota bacterium]
AMWNQVKADVTGFPVLVPRVLETAVLGCAILGAVAIGNQPDVEAGVRAMTAIVRRIEPRPESRDVYDATFEAYRALYPAIAPVIRSLDGAPA